MLIESKSSSKRRATARRMHFFVVCFRVHGFTAPTRRHARQRGGWGSPGPVRNNTRARQLDKTPRNHPTRLASRSGTPRRTRGGRALASRAAGPPRRRRRALSGDRSGVPSCRDCRAVARDGRGEWAGECGDRTEKDNKVNSHKSQNPKITEKTFRVYKVQGMFYHTPATSSRVRSATHDPTTRNQELYTTKNPGRPRCLQTH